MGTAEGEPGRFAVSVESIGDFVIVRDPREEAAPPLRFTRAEWVAFLEGVQRGEFDVAVPESERNTSADAKTNPQSVDEHEH